MLVRGLITAVAVICCVIPVFSSLTVKIYGNNGSGQSENNVIDGDIVNGQCPMNRTPLRKQCNVSLGKFKEAATDFTSCLISFIKPACFCEACYNPHKLLVAAYQAIRQYPDCTEKLLKSDRINAIEEIYSFATEVWSTRGRCEECFSQSGTPTETTQDFYLYLQAFDDCVKNSTARNESICKVCAASYSKLKTYYDDNFGNDPTIVCIDISDHMNASVREWERKNCHVANSQISIAVLAAVAVVIVSVIFYVSVYCYDAKQKRASPFSSRETTPDRREKVLPNDSSLEVTSDMASLN